MAKYKDEGSANEAMRPISPPDPDVARSVEGAASDYAKRMAELRKEAAARKAERDAAIKTRLAQPRPGRRRVVRSRSTLAAVPLALLPSVLMVAPLRARRRVSSSNDAVTGHGCYVS